MVELGESKRRRGRPAVAGRREALLDAGLRVMLERGYARATVDEIVGVAGVAKGTFYLYFTSKAELLRALRERFAAGLVARAEAWFQQVGVADWLVIADGLTVELIQYFVDHRQQHELLFHTTVQVDHANPVVDSERWLQAKLTEFVRQGAAAGAFHTATPDWTAAIIFHGLDGACLEAFHGGATDFAPLIVAARDVVRKSLS